MKNVVFCVFIIVQNMVFSAFISLSLKATSIHKEERTTKIKAKEPTFEVQFRDQIFLNPTNQSVLYIV